MLMPENSAKITWLSLCDHINHILGDGSLRLKTCSHTGIPI